MRKNKLAIKINGKANPKNAMIHTNSGDTYFASEAMMSDTITK